MADGRRYDLGFGDSRLDKKTFPLWHYGIVTDIDDPYDAGRIKVRIYPIDNDILDESLDNKKDSTLNKQQTTYTLTWCEPLLPKFINVVPKVGEMVKIITFDYRNKKIRRQYIGPVVGQQSPIDFYNSDYFDASIKVENNAYSAAWSKNPDAINDTWKIYPDKEDVGVLGRRNTDIILRDNNSYDEITLRSGKIDPKSIVVADTPNLSPFVLNKKNPGYISINFSQNNNTNINIPSFLNVQNNRSHINLVADRLNLISHLGSSKRNVGNAPVIIKGDDLLSQIQIENSKLHPLVYGDALWEVLNLIKNYVIGHIHIGAKLPSDPSGPTKELVAWFNNNMGTPVSKPNPDGTNYTDYVNCTFLSKGVRTN